MIPLFFSSTLLLSRQSKFKSVLNFNRYMKVNYLQKNNVVEQRNGEIQVVWGPIDGISILLLSRNSIDFLICYCFTHDRKFMAQKLIRGEALFSRKILLCAD